LSRRCFKRVLPLLDRFGESDVVPQSEGLTAGRVRVMAAELATEGQAPV